MKIKKKNFVKNFLIKLLKKRSPLPKNFDSKKYLYIDSGHIDSLALIRFISEIEKKYKIVFAAKDTESKEFRTIEGLTKLILKKT